MNEALFSHYIIERRHHAARRPFAPASLAEGYAERGLDYRERMADRFALAAHQEVPYIAEGEKIVFVRTVTDLPDILTPAEWEEMRGRAHVHGLGYVSNICPDYTTVIRDGLMSCYGQADHCQRLEIHAILALADRYREEAIRQGRVDIAEVLERVPRYGARTLREALQALRILHYALWLEGEYHNHIGRFDVLMRPYYERDRAAGMSREEALDLITDFLLSFNKDSDLYADGREGDAGQSMVLGGQVRPRVTAYCALSELCLEASRDLKLPAPRIHLRVFRETPLSVFEKATELAECGLGFLQYSNDDVIISGLRSLGYSEWDAYHYVLTACGEPIIPGVGDDIPNIAALNLPMLTDRAIREAFAADEDFTALCTRFATILREETVKINESIRDVEFLPSPFLDLLGRVRRYRNFGIHGSGIFGAVDALAAVDKYVYEEGSVTKEELLSALDADFEGYPELCHRLRYEAPKCGQDEIGTNALLKFVLGAMADACDGLKNCFGGVLRAGTGTAMYDLRHPEEHGATADGRHAGEPYGESFSPSLFARIPGPGSLVRTATEWPLWRTINGGPLTLEFSESVLRREDDRRKVAGLLQFYIRRGGHQLRLKVSAQGGFTALRKA